MNLKSVFCRVGLVAFVLVLGGCLAEEGPKAATEAEETETPSANNLSRIFGTPNGEDTVGRTYSKLSWGAPNENSEDGSALTDLPEYHIYWGFSLVTTRTSRIQRTRV